MKILIGTPIHVSKDYSTERWLQNVSKLQLEYPADLLIVDNSPSLEYMEKIKEYCKKYEVKNYQIDHLDFPPLQGSKKDIDEQIHERIAFSRETIRQKFIAGDYDAYFFWENDILIPADALGKLVKLMKTGNFMVVVHNCWINNIPNQPNFDYGIVLFSRQCLEKYSFLLDSTDPDMPDNWYEAELGFRRRLVRDRCTYTEVDGLIEPIYHLDK